MRKSIHSNEQRVLLTLLRELRERAGVTQEELATALKTTQSLVSKAERGERRLDVLELRAWCRALNKSFRAFAARLDEALD